MIPRILHTITLATCGLLLSAPARAITIDICVEHAVDYTDASSSVGDDYLTDNADVTASGVRVMVIRNSDDAVMFDDHAADSGPDAGCVTVTGLTTTSYKLRVLSEAYVNGNTVKVWNDDTNNQLYAYTIPFYTPPVLGETVELTTSLADQWRIMAVATFALRRSNAGLSGTTMVFYTQECSGGGSCLSHSNGRSYICPSATCDNNPHHKYLVAHEMGHLVQLRANGNQYANHDYTYTPSVCDSDGGSGHRINSEEYQGAAAVEGLAHFWAAYAFNHQSGSECGFDWYGNSVDWDYDDDANSDRFSCEGAPDPTGAPTVDGTDYHGDVCGGTDNKGVEYDWLRLGWDLVSDEDVPVEDIFAIWDEADPQSWNTNGSGVAEAMSDAADTVGWGTEYDTWAGVNGTDR